MDHFGTEAYRDSFIDRTGHLCILMEYCESDPRAGFDRVLGSGLFGVDPKPSALKPIETKP